MFEKNLALPPDSAIVSAWMLSSFVYQGGKQRVLCQVQEEPVLNDVDLLLARIKKKKPH